MSRSPVNFFRSFHARTWNKSQILSGISVSFQRFGTLILSECFGEFSCAPPMLVLVFVVTFLPDFLLFALSPDKQKTGALRLLCLLSSILFLHICSFSNIIGPILFWHFLTLSPFFFSLCRCKEANKRTVTLCYVSEDHRPEWDLGTLFL